VVICIIVVIVMLSECDLFVMCPFVQVPCDDLASELAALRERLRELEQAWEGERGRVRLLEETIQHGNATISGQKV
jgi:hypothetical protein